MEDLSLFDPNAVGNPNNTIFGLPFTEETAQLIVLPIPWEVTVSSGTGTSRAIDYISKASLQVDLFDPDYPNEWKKGLFLKAIDRKVLLKSDYLRKEAELYIDYIAKGNDVKANKFMSKSLREINEGSDFLNAWVYEQTKALLDSGKRVGLLGGDHSTPLGFFRAVGEKYGNYGILQIDAHCDLRIAYEDLKYSHASIMYNALTETSEISKLVQVGIRDYGEDEYQYIRDNSKRITTFFDKDIKDRLFEGDTWKQVVHDIISELPDKVYISFDADGLDPKLCPNTGTPVPGGFEVDQVFYLFKKLMESGRQIIGFDLNEVGVGDSGIDANVGARVLYRLCNMMLKSN